MQMPELEAIASEVIGAPVTLSREQSAADIPGWDSLNNTLIALEISARCNVEFTGEDMAACPTFGALLDAVSARTGASAA